MTYIEAAIVLLVASVMLALVAGYVTDAQRDLLEARLAVEMKELDDNLQGYAEAEYANLRRCAGGGTVPDNGVTREIDVPVYSLSAMRAGDQPLFFDLAGLTRPRTLLSDCVNDLDHNRDGDALDLAENYPKSLEGAGFLPTWMVRRVETGGNVGNLDRYGDSVGGAVPPTGGDRATWLARLEAEARGISSLVARPTYRFVDSDPAAGSIVPRLQIFTGLVRVPSRVGSATYELGSISGAAFRSGSPNIGIVPRHVDGNRVPNTVIYGPGDSWRVNLTTANPNVALGELSRLRLLCMRMTHVMPHEVGTAQNGPLNQNCHQTAGDGPGRGRVQGARMFIRHPAGLTENPDVGRTQIDFSPRTASAVLLTTISDAKFLDSALHRRYIGVPQANRMATDLDLGGFGIRNVSVIAGPDTDGDGVPDHPPVIVGPPSDRRTGNNRVRQPITLHGDVRISGKLFVGDGLDVADLGRPARAHGAADGGLRADGRYVSRVEYQMDPDPLPVTLAEIERALPEVVDPRSANGLPNTDITVDDLYGEGDLPFSGLPGVQFAGGVFHAGNTWTVGSTHTVGPRHNLVAVANYVDPTRVRYQQSWNVFHVDEEHDPEDVFAGDGLAVGDEAWGAGEHPRDHPLANLRLVNTHRDLHPDGEVRIVSSDGTKIVGGGERGGVTVFSPKGDTRIVAGSQVFLPYSTAALALNPNAGVPTGTAGGAEIWPDARQSSVAGNIILHNPERTDDTTRESFTGSPSVPDGGVIVLDPDRVFLADEDDAVSRDRGTGDLRRFANQDAEAFPDIRQNLQFLDDRDAADPGTAREIFPGSGVYDETRIASLGSRLDQVSSGGAPFTLHGPGLGHTFDSGPVAERIEGRPLSRAIPRLTPAFVDQSGTDHGTLYANPNGRFLADNRGSLRLVRNLATSGLIGVSTATHPLVRPGAEVYLPSNGGTGVCPDGGVSVRTAIPTSWIQPQHVTNSSDQILSWNLSVGGSSVSSPEYAGSSAVNLNYSTILPWRGWAVNPSTGEDASTYGGAENDAGVTIPDFSAQTTHTFLYYCIS